MKSLFTLGTNNLYPKNAVDIVHEETNPKVPIVKRKTKQSNKSKDIPDRERQLDEQLIQCKAYPVESQAMTFSS
jgi:hypothetical protein